MFGCRHRLYDFVFDVVNFARLRGRSPECSNGVNGCYCGFGNCVAINWPHAWFSG